MQHNHVGPVAVPLLLSAAAQMLDLQAARFENGFQNLFGFREPVDHKDALSVGHATFLPCQAGVSVEHAGQCAAVSWNSCGSGASLHRLTPKNRRQIILKTGEPANG